MYIDWSNYEVKPKKTFQYFRIISTSFTDNKKREFLNDEEDENDKKRRKSSKNDPKNDDKSGKSNIGKSNRKPKKWNARTVRTIFS